MCGIYCSIGVGSGYRCSNKTRDLLKARGPDSVKELCWSKTIPCGQGVDHIDTEIFVLSTVLALRGSGIQSQPLQAEHSNSFLCWNGEAWRHQGQVISGNDAHYVFSLLCHASVSIKVSTTDCIINALTGIAGPFAFVFYDGKSHQLYYGRDPIGRRSLVSQENNDGEMVICSISDSPTTSPWEEVGVGGLYVLNLDEPLLTKQYFPWPTSRPCVNSDLPQGQISIPTSNSISVKQLEQSLRISLRLRVEDIPTRDVLTKGQTRRDAKIAILFSGGLDCTVLARLAHDELPIHEPIDLLNVAFENPRSLPAECKANQDLSAYEACPDRKTARSSFSELLRVCSGREWRFIAVDVPFGESRSHYDTIVELMAPHKTEMDLSISMALYFAARGEGQLNLSSSQGGRPFQTKAQVLLSGLGADELFAGYTRHITASKRGGLQALVYQLDLDIQRLGQRNLGRDDRIISHWGREVRYPYLDEDLMAWALRLPIWEKTGLGLPLDQALHNREAVQITESTLDPTKRTLRLLAWRLGLHQVANEKKRAIQFGARTAKMNIGGGRVKGTDPITRDSP